MSERDMQFVLRFKNEAARQMKQLQGQFKKIATQVTKASLALARNGTALIKLGKQLQKAGAKAEKFGRRMTEVGSLFTTRLTAPIALMGAGIIRTAGQFEKSMNEVQGVINGSVDDFDRLKKAAADMGATTAFTATDAAQGLFFLAKTGLKTTEALEALPNVLNLAGASGLDLANAADIVTNITKGFGQELDRLPVSIDTLATAFTSANVDITTLSASFRKAGPVFSANNQTFEDTAAILGTIGDSGIQASEAGTGVRIVFQSLQGDAIKTKGVLNDLGVAIRNTDGSFRPLIDIFGDLADAGIDADQRLKLFGRRGDAIASIILEKTAPALREFSTQLQNTSGTAKRLADVQLKGLFGAFKILKSSVEAIAIEIGDSGLLKDITNIVRKTAEWVRSLRGTSAEILKNIVILGALLAAIGPVLASIGFMSLGLGALTSAFGSATVAMGKFSIVLSKLPPKLAAASQALVRFAIVLATNPLGQLALALTVIGVLLFKYRDALIKVGGETQTVTDFMVGLWEAFKDRVVPVFTVIGDTVLGVWQFISDATLTVVNTIGGFFDGFSAFVGGQFETIGDVAKFVGNALIKTFQLAVLFITTQFKILSIIAGNVFRKLQEEIKMLTKPFETIVANIKSIGTVIIDSFTLAGSFILDLFGFLGIAIGQFFDTAVEGASNLAEVAGKKLGEVAGDFQEFVVETAKGTVFEGVPAAMVEAMDEVKAILAGDPIGDFLEDAAKIGGARFAKRLKKDIEKALKDAVGPKGPAAGDAKEGGEKAGTSFAEGFAKGFNKGAEEFIVEAANAAAQGQKFFEDFSDASGEAIKGFLSQGELDFKSFGIAILESLNDIFTQRLQGQFLQMLGLGGQQGQAADFGSLLPGGGEEGGGLLSKAKGALGGLFGGGGEDGGSQGVVEAIDGQTAEQLTSNTGLFGGLISKIGSGLSSLGGLFTSGLSSLGGLFTNIIGGLGSGLKSALGGLGDVFSSGLSSLGSLFSGGGGGGGILGSVLGVVGGLFSTGGMAQNPQAFTVMSKAQMQGAKRFNSGGLTDSIPAMLSRDEAVVPLPNGRAIPVDMQNGGGAGGGTTVINFNLPDNSTAESFKESQAQVTARVSQAIKRAQARNN